MGGYPFLLDAPRHLSRHQLLRIAMGQANQFLRRFNISFLTGS